MFNQILIKARGLKLVRYKIIRGGKVDGNDEETNMAYQFHGCYWHECHECSLDREDVRLASAKRESAIMTFWLQSSACLGTRVSSTTF